ncbi:hypothetical protein K7432_006426 [Basidiobolus ranarum]|uniref:Uncharacterized protein n=1 Tax=Basidiobolus ranarum TaxID=34480 RepID=A0ABR2W227_9FUNG
MSSPESNSGDNKNKNPTPVINKNVKQNTGVYIPRFRRIEKEACSAPQTSETVVDKPKENTTTKPEEILQPRRGRNFDATSLRVYPDSNPKRTNPTKNYTENNNNRAFNKNNPQQTGYNQNRNNRAQPNTYHKTPSEKQASTQQEIVPIKSSLEKGSSNQKIERKSGRAKSNSELTIEELTKSVEKLSTDDARSSEQSESVPSTPTRIPSAGRPVTSDLVARRLVGNILGIKVSKSKEALDLEKKKLAEARAQRLAKKKQEAKRLEESERIFLE